MDSWNERLRFGVPVLVLGLGVVRVAVALVRLHLGLTEKQPKTPAYEFSRTTLGQRGTIYSSDGQPYAKSSTVWEYRLDALRATRDPIQDSKPISAKQRRTNMELVSRALGIPLVKVMDAYARTKKRYQLLAVSDSQEVHDLIATNHLSEIKITGKQKRLYPQGRQLSHVVGFVNHDPANTVGGAGIEQRYEKYLKGMPGQIHGEKDASGRERREYRDVDVDAVPGCDIYLTIDHNIQYEVEKALREGLERHRAEAVWAIVLSVKTGAVLAMASIPDYEPVNFNDVKADLRKNLAISVNYEPGSVMKVITACAVLNEGRHGPESRINTAWKDPNYYRLPTDLGHKWEETMTVREAVVHSSNIVFGKLGYDLGPTLLASYMSAFGLGKLTGIELPGEERGILPNPKDWDQLKWSRAPIGQGVSVTAIQMAAAYAAIGNGGTLLRPYIVDRIVQADGTVVFQHKPEVVGQPVTPSVARNVLDMMVGVTQKGGTARRAAVRGYSVAGKTGTAQIPAKGTYSNNDYNASFIGVVPASNPEIVVLVTYHHPFYCRTKKTSEAMGVPIYNHQGGLCAAPTFRDIASVVLRYLQVAPDLPDEVPDEFPDEDEEEDR